MRPAVWIRVAKLGVEIRKGSFFLEEDRLGKILNETVGEDLKKRR